MAKAGATSIWWADYEGYFHLETTSEKLVETLAASGIKWAYRDEETGVYHYKLPTVCCGLAGIPRSSRKACWRSTKTGRS